MTLAAAALLSAEAYIEDNLAFRADGHTAPLTVGNFIRLAAKPSWPDKLIALPASAVEAHVAQHAGARPRDRDETDRRIIAELSARNGHIIDSQDQVGGYPRPAPTRRELSVPTVDEMERWLTRLASELER